MKSSRANRSTKKGVLKFSNETAFLAWLAGRKPSTFTTGVNEVLDEMIQKRISKVSAGRVTGKSTVNKCAKSSGIPGQ